MTRSSVLDAPAAGPVDDDPAYLTGPVLRGVLVALGALLVVLAGMLTLGALDIAITPSSTAIAVGGYSLLALGGTVLWVRAHPGRARPAVAWRRIVGGLVTAVVLVGAVALAQAIQPAALERFVTLEATATEAFADGVVSVPAGDEVDLGWQLHGFGVQLAADPLVTVTVDAAVPANLTLATDSDPAAGESGTTSGTAGRVSFTAPTAPGRHDVVITIADQADPVGSQALVLRLKVTR